jgi:hypothetical protein
LRGCDSSASATRGNRDCGVPLACHDGFADGCGQFLRLRDVARPVATATALTLD